MSFKLHDMACEFSMCSARDGLRVTSYSARLEDDDVEKSADAFEAISLIGLKYLTVNGVKVHDIAGLIGVFGEDDPMLLTKIATEFIESLKPFIESLKK